ncbi:uncharacterized protein LOC144748634 [Ciona intestinalis]
MENMFQKLQKKIIVSERKLNSRLSKCSLFSKPRILNHSMSPVVSPAVETPPCDETMVVVERPAPNVRLVLFKEFGDTSDRKIVFDSKSLQRVKQELSAREQRHASLTTMTKCVVSHDEKSRNCAFCLFRWFVTK